MRTLAFKLLSFNLPLILVLSLTIFSSSLIPTERLLAETNVYIRKNEQGMVAAVKSFFRQPPPFDLPAEVSAPSICTDIVGRHGGDLMLNKKQQKFIVDNLEVFKSFVQKGHGLNSESIDLWIKSFPSDPSPLYSKVREMIIPGESTANPSIAAIRIYRSIISDANATKKILALSDKKNGLDPLSIAEKIAPSFIDGPSSSSITIVQADYEYSTTATKVGGIHQIKVDNTAAFPDSLRSLGREGNFDVIIGRRMLCFCDDMHEHLACGGISKNKESLVGLIDHTTPFLNLSNPKAMAVFHGGSRDFNVISLWQSAVDEINSRSGSTIAVSLAKNPEGAFFALVITPKPQ